MLIRDAATILVAQPRRLISQGLGIALGATLFVVALGLGDTISGQVDDTFDAVKATTVTVDLASASGEPESIDLGRFVPQERMAAVRSIPGVVSASRFGVIREQNLSVQAVGNLPPFATQLANVVVADGSLLTTVGASLDGFGLSAVDDSARRDLSVIGRGLAASLGIERPGPSIALGGSLFKVVGIIQDTERLPDLLNSMVVSQPAAASALTAAALTPRAIVKTTPGAGEVVAVNLALQLRPDAPEQLSVTAPMSPRELHRTVSDDLRALSLGAAVVVLIAGVFAAANLMLFAVTQRTGEIGMRRALGASAAQVLGMIVLEAAITGSLAGSVGTVLGLWVLLGICIANQWAPVIGLSVIWVGMLAGTTGGILGGTVPGIMAARVQPAQAVRA